MQFMSSNINNMKQAVFEVFGVNLGTESNERVTTATDMVVSTPAEVASVAEPAPLAVPVTPAAKEAAPVMAAPYTLSPVSFLAEGCVWEGTLRSEGDVEVSCAFCGELCAKGAVKLHATMEGNVTAGSLTLSGCKLKGDVVCDDLMVISRDSHLSGSIVARELRCAGVVEGDISAAGAVILESSARVIGNIDAGSLTVDKGAVLQGGLTIKG